MKRLICLLALSGGIAASAAFSAGWNPAVSLAYHGDMLAHPGFRVGVTVSALQWRWLSLEPGVDAGYFVHPRNERALFVLGSVGGRLSTPVGFETSLRVGAGYKRGYADGAVYGFAGDGTAERVRNRGTGAFLASGDVEFGWRVNESLSVHLGPNASVEYPYNGFWLPRLALVTGVTCRIGGDR